MCSTSHSNSCFTYRSSTTFWLPTISCWMGVDWYLLARVSLVYSLALLVSLLLFAISTTTYHARLLYFIPIDQHVSAIDRIPYRNLMDMAYTIISCPSCIQPFMTLHATILIFMFLFYSVLQPDYYSDLLDSLLTTIRYFLAVLVCLTSLNLLPF